MRNRSRFLSGLFFILLLSGCSILSRERIVRNKGVESDDFDLPLILYKSSHLLTSKMVVLLSGDGGWLTFNDSLAVSFTKAGYDVIGFNSRSYFWHRKTPEQTSADFTRLLRKYMKLWNDRRITLNGYSFGADVVPFIYNRLPEDLKARVTEIQLLSPFLSTDFEVYLTDLVNLGGDDRTYKVKDEVAKINIPVYCFYGQEEDPKPLAGVSAENFHLTLLPGDHHYTGGYSHIITSAGRGLLPFNSRSTRKQPRE